MGLDQDILKDYKPLRDVIYENIRKAIIRGDFSPGERIMEIQLAEKLGVSRTPVREAIRKLELDGLVEMIPRKGTYIKKVIKKDIEDIFEVRKYLEALAAFLAAQRIKENQIKEMKEILVDFDKYSEQNDIKGLIEMDTKFHDALFRASGNEKLVEIAQSIKQHVYRYRVLYINDYGNKEGTLSKEHHEILDAIIKRDPQTAEKLSREHVNKRELDMYNQL